MESIRESLINKLHQRSAKVSVVGLGYVGLPLAAVFADAGFDVTGIDLDQEKIEAINRGESYIQDVDTAQLSRLVSAGAWGRKC